MKQIPMFKVYMSPDVVEPVKDVLLSGYVGQGDQVDRFEEELAAFIGNPYVSTTNSCTSALTMAMRISHTDRWFKDEILTTPLTCTATNIPIVTSGMKLKWVDVDPETCNMDMEDLVRKLSERTAMILVVHWGGLPCDIDALHAAADRCQALYGHRPLVVEDCAHAIGSTYKGKMIGNHGNVNCYSFGPIKHLCAGDGGAFVAPNQELHDRVRLMRWYGLDRTSKKDFRCCQNIQEAGYKFHMNDINAAIGRANLKTLSTVLKTQEENGRYYDEALKGVPGVTLLKSYDDRTSVCWIYTMHVENRDGFIEKMKEHGVSVSRVHDRNDKHQCFSEARCVLPSLDKICETMICIPSGWWVTPEDREYIVDCVKKGW